MAINYTFPLSGTWSSPRWLTRGWFPPGISSPNGRRVTLEATYSHRAKLLTTECSSVGKFTTRGAVGCWRTPTEELWQPLDPGWPAQEGLLLCCDAAKTPTWNPRVWQKFFETVVVAKERTLQPKPRIPGVMWFCTHRLFFRAIVLRFWKADWEWRFS